MEKTVLKSKKVLKSINSTVKKLIQKKKIQITVFLILFVFTLCIYYFSSKKQKTEKQTKIKNIINTINYTLLAGMTVFFWFTLRPSSVLSAPITNKKFVSRYFWWIVNGVFLILIINGLLVLYL